MTSLLSTENHDKMRGNINSDPPLLVATALPPELTYQTVTIDDDADVAAQETTPLVAMYSSSSNRDLRYDDNENVERNQQEEENQSMVFRDWFFAVLFCLQIICVILSSVLYSPKGYENIDKSLNYTWVREKMEAEADDMTPEQWDEFDSFVSQTSDYLSVYAPRIIIWTVVPSALIGFFWVHMAVMIMPKIANLTVKATLVVSLIIASVLLIVLFVSAPSFGVLVIVAIMAAAVVYYVRMVWPIVGFAAVNLKAATQSINANMGTHVWAFMSCMLGAIWTCFWVYSTIGILAYMDGECWENLNRSKSINEVGTDIRSAKHSNEDPDLSDCGQGAVFFLLLLSGYWTAHVLMNAVEVTVAGVVATWCYDREAADGCCSPAVASSLFRSLTYSFGSICLGSLFQGAVQLFRRILPDRSRGHNDDECCGLCFCVLECCGRVLNDILDYFHQWAYVFIGIYGYGYIESGKRVLDLFVSKGWTSIISERLVSYVTACLSLTVGFMTGLSVLAVIFFVDTIHTSIFDVVYDEKEGAAFYVFGPLPRQVSFFIGFAVGTVTASVMMSVVKGGVNTVIVCFADSPARLEANHPELLQEIIDAWSTAFPDTIQKSAFEPPVAEPITYP